MGGRLTLIRLVLSSIPIYHMLVCVFLEAVKKKLCGLFYRFLWGGLEEKNKLHMVNWDTISVPIVEGGLRVLDLGDMNIILVAKWIFKYANNREALWRKIMCARNRGCRR